MSRVNHQPQRSAADYRAMQAAYGQPEYNPPAWLALEDDHEKEGETYEVRFLHR